MVVGPAAWAKAARSTARPPATADRHSAAVSKMILLDIGSIRPWLFVRPEGYAPPIFGQYLVHPRLYSGWFQHSIPAPPLSLGHNSAGLTKRPGLLVQAFSRLGPAPPPPCMRSMLAGEVAVAPLRCVGLRGN